MHVCEHFGYDIAYTIRNLIWNPLYLFRDIAHHNEYILMAQSLSAGKHDYEINKKLTFHCEYITVKIQTNTIFENLYCA